MQILVETDHNLKAGDLTPYVEAAVSTAVDRFADYVTHVEAHVSDNNSREKSGDNDIRCLLEARLAGVKSVAVTHDAASIDMAIDGAADRLQRALQSSLQKLQDRERRAEDPGHMSADIARQPSESS